MFKNLKISTGINLLLSIFVVCIIATSSFGLMSSSSTAHDFDDTMLTNDNIDVLNSAVFDLTNAGVQINTLILNVLANKPVDQDDIADAKMLLAEGKAKMDKFMSTPFKTEEEKQIGIAAQKRYESIYAFTLKKLNYITNPNALSNDISDETKQRIELRKLTHQYLGYTGDLIQGYAESSHHDIQLMTAVSVAALLLAAICAITSHLWLKCTVFNRLEQANTAFQTIASGNLSEKIEIGSQNEIGRMLAEVEKMRHSLTDTVYGIRNGVKHIYSNAQEIASSNNDLSARTEQQASALQETAASMEELKITVRQNADNAHSARQLAESASSSAQKGGDVMINLDKIMTEITVNSRQIADINSVIDSIANQTNILALNAAVEAARAGEQGRGFAVVAGEVRNLAKRSADAAKEIRQLINTCVANMNTGSQEVEQAGTAMNEIVQSVIQVTNIMAEIASASDEQSTGINQIAQAVNEMDLVTQQNAAMVENAATVASSVEEYAGDVDEIVAQFRVNEMHVSAHVREKSKKEIAHVKTVTPAKRELTLNKKSAEQWESF
ncbi:methyl-accepting chemotaxis protein [Salmonella enterica]